MEYMMVVRYPLVLQAATRLSRSRGTGRRATRLCRLHQAMVLHRVAGFVHFVQHVHFLPNACQIAASSTRGGRAHDRCCCRWLSQVRSLAKGWQKALAEVARQRSTLSLMSLATPVLLGRIWLGGALGVGSRVFLIDAFLQLRGPKESLKVSALSVCSARADVLFLPPRSRFCMSPTTITTENRRCQ